MEAHGIAHCVNVVFKNRYEEIKTTYHGSFMVEEKKENGFVGNGGY